MTIVSCPNEIPSISVYVVAAQSQDGIFAESTRPWPENNKDGLVQYAGKINPWNRRKVIICPNEKLQIKLLSYPNEKSPKIINYVLVHRVTS